MSNYREARSIGILYDASTEKQYQIITHLVRDLQQDQKKVKTLGYVVQKQMPDYSFPKLTFEFCNSKDFAWNQKPKSLNVKDFISNDYDLLMDLTPSDFFHIKFLVAESAAHFKIGRYAEKYLDLYDLMIQVEDTSPLDEVIKHSIYYLKMINNDQGENQ